MKAVIFDLDRTLHDRDASVIQFLKSQHRRLSTMSQTDIPASYIDRFVELECKGYVWKDKVYRALAEEFTLPLSPDELLHDYLTDFHQHCREITGASLLLTSLKTQSFKVGMVTNGMTSVQNRTIEALGMRPYFDSIVISEEAGMKKPDPKIFEIAAEALGVSPESCIYVGDHYENDILAARQAGMKTAWLTDGHSLIKEDAADVIVTSLAELEKYFAN